MSTTDIAATSEMDHLDQLGAKAFDGFLVRKDLVRKYSRQYPVPTYVVEFLLGRYCASTDPAEIEEGLQIVEKQLQGRTVRTGEEELFKARSRDQGSVKIIDIVRARLDTRSDSYAAEVPSLAIKDAQIDDELVRANERMLTDGCYAEVSLEYDPVIAQERNGRPFRIAGLRPIQMSNPNVLGILAKGRAAFTTEEWRDFLIRSIGLEPTALDGRAKMVVLLRMAPFVERNFNLVELGPRGTGKSHLFQQISPYSHLISGGKATVAKMFVNNGNGQRGLVCQYDVVCLDEVAGVSFDQKDGVNILKGYMASGEFSRGKVSIRADVGIVMAGNFDVDVEQQQRIGTGSDKQVSIGERGRFCPTRVDDHQSAASGTQGFQALRDIRRRHQAAVRDHGICAEHEQELRPIKVGNGDHQLVAVQQPGHEVMRQLVD